MKTRKTTTITYKLADMLADEFISRIDKEARLQKVNPNNLLDHVNDVMGDAWIARSVPTSSK
jgi:hypothetical protein